MSPRQYQQQKRAQNVEDMRRRIVEATFALHTEQGVAATTMKQIAQRADVSVGSVYHHFPTYEHCIAACRDYTFENFPLPDSTAIAAPAQRADRVRALVHAWAAYYRGYPALEKIRYDRNAFPLLDEALRGLEQQADALAATALQVPASDPRVGAVSAMLDPAVFSALQRRGVPDAPAAEMLTDLINAWLDTGATGRDPLP